MRRQIGKTRINRMDNTLAMTLIDDPNTQLLANLKNPADPARKIR